MGVEGRRSVGGGVSGCLGPIGLQPWLPTTGMPGPHPLAGRDGGASGGPQMLTSGPGPPSLGSRVPGHLLPHFVPPPAEEGVGGQAPGPALPHPPRRPTACPAAAWGGVGRASETLGEACTSLDPHPCLPLARKSKGAVEVRGRRFAEGHGAKQGTMITVITRSHPGQKPAQRLSGPPGGQ